ncbi:MAG: MMPL family transporter [Myxococcales bacterium]|nr:MMPL family transporter [Myxococcota bacterium]MDW8280367.1 MMPL family transporter [Myxococcales bacterium]
MPAGPRKSPLSRLLTLVLGHPRVVLALVGVLILLASLGLGRLREEEDPLAFLPGQDPDVVGFRLVAKRFGALRVALIGVEPHAPLFSADVLSRLERLSAALRNIEGVDRVVSLSTMTDLEPGGGGVEVRPLIPSPVPTDPGELARLRDHALSLPQVRGTLVSADGRATLVLVFLAEGASTRRVAERARSLAQAELPHARLYFGGAPFAAQTIYDGTRLDVRRLTPLALALFFLVVLASFRDWLAVLLTVGTVGVAGILVVGGMGLVGEPFTVVAGMLPVTLFAAGSQYAIHILGRYYLLRLREGPLESARGAIRIAGPPVTIAAVATSLGFLSFLVMNIAPMRAFGVACAVGIFFCWLLSMTVLPACVVAWPRPYHKHRQLLWAEQAMEDLWSFVVRYRWTVVAIIAVIFAAAVRFSTQVTVRMEPRAFFRPGSEPAEAQAFLDNRFGGSQFLLVAVEGDVTHPHALRELRRFATCARALPGVTQVQTFLDPLLLVSQAMGLGRGLPAARSQVGSLLFFIEGEPSFRALLTQDRRSALVHVRVSGDIREALAGLERYLGRRWPFSLRAATLAEEAEEVACLVPPGERERRLPAITAALEQVKQQAERIRAEQQARPGADAEVLDEAAERAAEERRTALVRELVDRVLQAALPHEPVDAERRASVEVLVESLLQAVPPAESAEAPAGEAALRGFISGEPVLDRGFSRAVEQNQWASLRVAIIAVFVALLLTLRSVSAAVLCMLPAGLSLTVIFGVLGWSGRPIDIGTSLVGSIVTGSGADFAMHYMWYLQRNQPREVARNIGPIIFVTAVLLAAGLGVLALGNSPPLRLFGWLAAAGLCLSATFTFLLVPALLRKTRSERRDF